MLKRISEVIKDFIRKLKGYPQAKSIVADLDYLDNYVEGLINSEDKKITDKNGERYKLNQSFIKEYDAWDKKDTNKVFNIGTTSNVLQSIGIKNQSIIMRSGMILQKISKHSEMNYDIFKQIPNLLENPIIVQFSDAIDEKTGKQKYESRITVLGEWKQHFIY